MTHWLNILIWGILLGGYYSLIACGLAFMFQVMRIINLAHGALAIMAAFVVWAIASQSGINPFYLLILVIPGMMLVGWILQWAVIERSARFGILVPILATFGLTVLINNSLFATFGADPRSLAPFIGAFSYSSWAVGNIYISKLAAMIFAVAVILLGSLSLFLSRTPLGRAIRATASNPEIVGLIGINPRTVNIIATAIAMATVGIAGVFLAMRSSTTPYSGITVLIFAFEATIIGGAGSLWGTLVGGIVLGLAQSFGNQFSTQGFLISGHLVFLVVLIVRTMPELSNIVDRLKVIIKRPTP